MERTEIDRISSRAAKALMAGKTAGSSFLTRVAVYQDSSCLFEEDFSKPYITIGRSPKTDIVLQDTRISRRHVEVYIENDQIFAFVAPRKKAMMINGKPAKAALLEPDDTIELGPYTLRVQTRSDEAPSQIEEDLRYQVVFEGKMKKGQNPHQVAKYLKKKLKLNDQQTASLISGKPFVIKQDLDLQEAIKFNEVFEQSGAIGQVQAVIKARVIDANPHDRQSIEHLPGETDKRPKNGKSVAHLTSGTEKEPKNGKSIAHLTSGTEEEPKNGKSIAHLGIQSQPFLDPELSSVMAAAEDEEDEDDDDCEATFSLKEKLSTFGAYDRRPQNRELSPDRPIGVFKFREDTVIDVRYLNSKESYFTHSSTGRFRLAQKNGSDKGYLYFNEGFTGTVGTKESGPVSITELLVRDNLYRKRKGIYRLPIPDMGEVIINDGSYDYLIRPIIPSQSPAVPEGPRAKTLSWKHGALSLAVHMLFLVVLAFLSTAQLKEAPEPETRFVQVDPHLLEKIQKKNKPVVKPPPPKPKETKPATKPVKRKEPVKKKEAVKKRVAVKKKPARVSKKPPKTSTRRAAAKSSKKARKSTVSKHPNAGGGSGKGNTRQRNVNQVGILSMLGDGKGPKVQSTIADVTNLDAVKSANSSQANFKVGGIKGKLGTSEISVTGGNVVATKGNSQVLRSYGAEGKGRVAALKKGNIGQKQVKGMVQARLNKSVRIRGGMSREAVKRVIEQHLDEITYCYETALISNPTIKGKITMEWKILMSGAVGEVRIKSSTVKSPAIYGCIKSAIKSWRFPKPVGNEVVVSYPFIFDIVGF
jgi:pSer/pThr/pTyr-binding forkhead associated (FHA) protein/outer membrane biosynthesis protein TonB